jgi:flagellar motor switch protein FliM
MVENASPLLDREPARSGRGQPAQHASALGNVSANPLGDLQALGLVNQHLARSLRALFEPLLRQPLKAAAEPIAVERFDAYMDRRCAGLTSVTLIGMAPLSGQAMLVLDGALTLQLVDLYFGGPGIAPSPLPAEFTPSAEAMIARLAKGVSERLAGAWAELAEIEFRPGRTETNPAMLSHIEGEDRVVLTRFTLATPTGRQVVIDILYPAATLKPIAGILSSKVQARREPVDTTWSGNLARAVMNVKLPVRSVLAEPVIPLAQLMRLQPGDIIPISFGPEIPMLVAGKTFARGGVGAANGRAALRLNRIEPIEDEDQA